MDWNHTPKIDGPRLSLIPLLPDHWAEFASICDPECFRYYPAYPASLDEGDLRSYIQGRIDTGVRLLLALKADNGEPIALSSFMDIKPDHRGLEIGHTLIRLDHRGTWVNPEMKRMMMAYAFEELGARRVQLKGDARNARSRAAMLKIGAQFEGVLRSLMLLPNGEWRDTAFYSVLDTEWPKTNTLLAELVSNRS